MRPIDLIIIAVIAILLIFAARRALKSFKSGGCCGCSSCSNGACSLKSPISARASSDSAGSRGAGKLIIGTRIVEIKGMHCDNCKKNVEKALNSIEGLTASVDLKKGEARITAEAVDEGLIKKAIGDLGFEVVSIR